MRVCKSNKNLLVAALFFCLTENSAAGDRFVKIEQAKLTYQQMAAATTVATLSADLEFYLSETASDALHSGISLYWEVSVVLKQKHWSGWWYSTLLAQTNRYRLSYYTLFDHYRLKDEQAQVFRRFSTLAEALVYMRHLVYKDLPLPQYDAAQCVLATLKISFDKEMLPAPLRPIAYFDKQWDLSANERQWCD
ncbi:MAG: DUF4390 domain-containing protein [Methyloprofundus sp.]|nr:DUF4390 domain-containing protein [Methyloprofundus sp.]